MRENKRALVVSVHPFRRVGGCPPPFILLVENYVWVLEVTTKATTAVQWGNEGCGVERKFAQ